MRLLLLAAGGLGVSFMLGGVLLSRTPSQAMTPGLACPALAPRVASADRIELSHAGQVLWLERRGTVWGLARQGGYPAQPGRADALMRALLNLRLLATAPGALASLGLADPAQAEPGGGTLVRVLGTSGATLCAIITGLGPAVRRSADPAGWLVNTPVETSVDPEQWSQHALPPLDPALVRTVPQDGGLGSDQLKTLLAALPFDDVRARPLVRVAPLRTVALDLANGTAVLTVGTLAGQSWLVVSGTSPWASGLAAYAFALPANSPLAPA